MPKRGRNKARNAEQGRRLLQRLSEIPLGPNQQLALGDVVGPLQRTVDQSVQPVAATVGGLLPGSGYADAFGVLPQPGGGHYPSYLENVGEGRFLDATLQGLGIAGDTAMAVPMLAPIGAVMKAPRQIQRTMRLPTQIQEAFEAGKAVRGRDHPAPELVTVPTPRDPTSSRISTRQPTAPRRLEDPLVHDLRVDVMSMSADPESFEKNVSLFFDPLLVPIGTGQSRILVPGQYNSFRPIDGTPEQRASYVTAVVTDNLLALYDAVPPDIRARSKLWYEGAHRIAQERAAQYGMSPETVAAVYAALSPRRDWFMNVSLGDRVMDIVANADSLRWTPEMTVTGNRIYQTGDKARVFPSIVGKRLNDLETDYQKALWLRAYDETHNPRWHNAITPEGDFLGPVVSQTTGQPINTASGTADQYAKAISVIETPTIENISNRMGQAHKVRNFYNNITDPFSPAGDVTMDTHAVAAALLKALSANPFHANGRAYGMEVMHSLGGVGSARSTHTGIGGTYALYADGYRQAAERRGVMPREMQSITWEAIRGLFPRTWKQNTQNVVAIENVWDNYYGGYITAAEARDQISRIAGGIGVPVWAERGR